MVMYLGRQSYCKRQGKLDHLRKRVLHGAGSVRPEAAGAQTVEAQGDTIMNPEADGPRNRDFRGASIRRVPISDALAWPDGQRGARSSLLRKPRASGAACGASGVRSEARILAAVADYMRSRTAGRGPDPRPSADAGGGLCLRAGAGRARPAAGARAHETPPDGQDGRDERPRRAARKMVGKKRLTNNSCQGIMRV